MNAVVRDSVRSGARFVVLAFLVSSTSLAFEQHASHRAPPRAAAAAKQPDLAEEAPLVAENDTAMTRMINGMAVTPTGNVDRDFVAMMVPHHQGAIDMARALLRYGRNEPLRLLAQEIIVTQQQEIAAMRLAVGEPLPPSAPAPTQPGAVRTPILRKRAGAEQ